MGRQLLIYTSLYISYTVYIYVRRSVAFSIPALVAEGFDKSQIGLITSSQSIAYAISKFFSGILVDSVSPRALLSGGLILSGVTAVGFTGFSSSPVLCVWWFMNGISQGPGWPSAAMILKKWCPPSVFGTVWSILSTSMNVAGTAGPLITAFFISRVGWRESMGLAGTVSIFVGCITFIMVKDKPNEDSETVKEKKEEKPENYSRWKILMLPGFLGVCLCYMTLSVIQHGVLQWAQLYLVEDKKHSMLIGSGFVSSVEVGGIVGSFIAGYCSDLMISKNSSVPQHQVRKTLWTHFLILLAVALFSFSLIIDTHTSKVVITVIGFLVGLATYGPISIAGVIAIEAAPKNISGTTYAVAGLFSNIGVFTAGLPLSYIAKTYNLQTTFLLLSTACVVMVTYLLLKLKSELASHRGRFLKVFLMR